MTLSAFRLTKAKYAGSAFDGEGAIINGGRWNPVGVPVVYLAGSLPLAVLETLVHLERSSLLDSYVYFEVQFESEQVLAIADDDLPADWQVSPEPSSTMAIGEAWVERQASLLLQVPSVVIPRHYNYLLNPVHPDRDQLTIQGPWPFSFDP